MEKLLTRLDVAKALEISEKQLRYILYAIPEEKKYITFYIPKKDGTVRTIESPRKELKIIQKKLYDFLNKTYKPNACVNGFCKTRGIRSNAIKHINKKIILNIDLNDFFHQIHFGRIRGVFLHNPYNFGEEASTVLAQIACYKGRLPQGSPCSPILSNLVCRRLDIELMQFAKKINVSILAMQMILHFQQQNSYKAN